MLKHEWNVSAFPASHCQLSLRFLFSNFGSQAISNLLCSAWFRTKLHIKFEISTQVDTLEWAPSPFCFLYTAFLNLLFLSFNRVQEYSLPILLYLSSFLKLQFTCHCWPLISTACSPAVHVLYLTVRVWEGTQKVREKISSLYILVQTLSDVNQHRSAEYCCVPLKSSDLTMAHFCGI